MAKLPELDGEPTLIFEELLFTLQRARQPIAQVDRLGAQLDQHERSTETAGHDREPRTA
jgi:hypothetical protein